MRLLILVFLFILPAAFAQKYSPFSGKLVYSIEICDTSLTKMIPPTQMVIYTNDTLLRIENTTDQLGQQVIIKHLLMNKSYLLIQTPINNYAIHSDHSTEKRDTFPYSFEKKLGGKKIAGMRAKKLLVSHKNFTEPMTVYYLKKYSVKYVNTLENFPGLPVEYYISSVDGTYKYTLKSMEAMTPEKDLFGIPSNYKKVSFDEFMDEILQFQQQTEEMPKVHE
jgi:hypothetical protein